MYRDPSLWQKIRRRILSDGAPKRQVAREAGISRATIRKILAHERPPGYGPRERKYRNLAPYIPAIECFLTRPASGSITVQAVVSHLRAIEGFTGSYSSVRNYLLRRADDDKCRNENNNDKYADAYSIITRLPEPRAIAFVSRLSTKGLSFLFSNQMQSFKCATSGHGESYSFVSRARQRSMDFEWMQRVASDAIDKKALSDEFEAEAEPSVLLSRLRNGSLLERTRALIVLARVRNIPIRTISACLGVSRRTIRAIYAKFQAGGTVALFQRQTKSNRKIDDPELRDAIFRVIHEPPCSYGINRTTWTMRLVCDVLNAHGHRVGSVLVRKMLKRAGYTWRKAKVVLTSNDPAYREKLAKIQAILSTLDANDAFFSIDEYGPFAIKAKGGRRLVPPGTQPTVPQWQKSRGCLIVTAAIELSSNQITHFYSQKKNTDEMIRMLNLLIERYNDRRRLYLSWDAASWHISKRLQRRIDENNSSIPTSRTALALPPRSKCAASPSARIWKHFVARRVHSCVRMKTTSRS